MVDRPKLLALAALIAMVAPAATFAAKASAVSPVKYECPDGYQVKEGLNVDFPHKGEMRAFVIAPPIGATRPAPVWVPLTGTVESTAANLTVARSGANALMAQKGFMVIGPVRNCSRQDPNDFSQACNGPGKDGWNWDALARGPRRRSGR